MLGFQAEGAAPLVLGHPVDDPQTVATAIRIGRPGERRSPALRARDESGGRIDAVADEEILAAYRDLARYEGIFCEPASAASVAGVRKLAAEGRIDPGATIVAVLTGTGLKDPDTGATLAEPGARGGADAWRACAARSAGERRCPRTRRRGSWSDRSPSMCPRRARTWEPASTRWRSRSTSSTPSTSRSSRRRRGPRVLVRGHGRGGRPSPDRRVATASSPCWRARSGTPAWTDRAVRLADRAWTTRSRWRGASARRQRRRSPRLTAADALLGGGALTRERLLELAAAVGGPRRQRRGRDPRRLRRRHAWSTAAASRPVRRRRRTARGAVHPRPAALDRGDARPRCRDRAVPRRGPQRRRRGAGRGRARGRAASTCSRAATVDRLHEPYRAAVYPELPEHGGRGARGRGARRLPVRRRLDDHRVQRERRRGRPCRVRDGGASRGARAWPDVPLTSRPRAEGAMVVARPCRCGTRRATGGLS